ncbi:MAG: rod-binding protein [Alphaproteobacteria bacterium]|nr:rod-binding protein [Alphaproteobacteria bacterium]
MMDALANTSLMTGAMPTGAMMPGISAGAMASIDKTAQDFEGMFMAQMLQPMFDGIEADKMFGGGHGEEVMRSFMVQEYGKSMARSAHFGLADAIKKSMLQKQERSMATPAMTPSAVSAAYQQTQDQPVNQQTP